jgi:signal transduction histidine kinase
LYRFDRRSGQLIHYPPEPAYDRGLSHANVSVIREAVDGTLWIGTLGGGLNAWDPRTQQFSRYLHAAGDSFSIADNLIYDLEIDSLGDLWIGTASGLSRMDPRSGRSLNFLHNPSDSTTLSNDVVECVRLSSAGHPWIGTLYGLNCYDPLSGRMHRFSTRDGLPSNKIYGILEDAGGDLWISTANGLSRFRIEGYGTDGRPQIATRNFFRSDGLQSNEFTQGLCFKNRNGELYFAGVNGITVFHPDHVRTALDTPLVILTSFKKFDQTVRLPQRLSELAELMLAYEENFFGFEFVALDFHAPYKNRYKYRMEGFDHDWVYAGTRRYATYTNLDPGRYRFVVMGSNHDGVWNTREASIVVTILPPWWRTWWFRLTAVAVVAVAVWWLHRLRLRRLLDIERMRVRIASDLHDDIGATLTRIALRSETIQNLENGKDIRTAARHIGEMSREVIRVMSDIVWSIDARNDTMGDLVTRVQDTAFSLLSPREIQCRFDTTEIDANRTIQADVRQNIFLICKEALHNVARHSDATEVHVRFALRAGLSVTIRDNGTKSLPSESRGSGIRNMRMRAQRIGGSVEFIYEHGVTVRVRVPDAHPSSWGFLMRLKSLFLFS